MPIEPRQLRVLLAVARSGSFTAAAEQLNMSQPAVSMVISQLEDAVGASVAKRDRKGATLTAVGEMLLRRAKTIENVLSHTERELAQNRLRVEGPLVVGGTPGAIMSLAPPAVALLQGEIGDYTIALEEARDDELAELLRSRKIDLALCTGAKRTLPEDIEERLLMTEPFVLIARGGFAAPETGLTVAEAARHQWIFPLADGATRRQLEAVFLSAGVAAPRRVIYSDSLATMKALMRVSDYITVLPQSVVAAEIEAGILHSVPLIGGPPPRQLAAWRMKFDEPTPLAKRFLASVEQACKARLSQDA